MLSVSLGNWNEVPIVGDEIEVKGGILIVKKRRWKNKAFAFEISQKVCLLCELKGETDGS